MKPNLDLQLLKAAADRSTSTCLDIELPDGTVIGSLLLAGSWILEDTEILDQVTEWRRRNMRMFLSQFDATSERTRTYFRELVLAKPDRAFFLLFDPAGTVMGHMGIANWGADSAELDNVVRGVGGGHPRLMQFAERRLLDWVFENSSARKVFARVLSYNWMAQDLHSTLGFVNTQSHYLRKVVTAATTGHEIVPPESANVPYKCVVMEIEAPAPRHMKI